MLLSSDLKRGFRQLRRRPLPGLVVTLTLALGLGANTAAFSAVRAVLLGQPWRDPQGLLLVTEQNPKRGLERVPVSYPDFADWRRQAGSFEALAALPQNPSEPFVWRAADGPLAIAGMAVSAELFDVLGVRPALGRGFRPEDDRPGAARVVVLSHALWQGAFGGDASLPGRALQFGQTSFTVVGVMPAGFDFPHGVEAWTPLVPAHPELVEQRQVGWLQVVGRLRPGTSAASARSELSAVIGRLAREYTPEQVERSARAERLDHALLGSARPALLLAWVAVALVLLIACANVAALLLAEALAARRDTALHLALGATPARMLVSQIAVALAPALLAGALALPLAWGCLALLRGALPADLPGIERLGLDAGALAFTAAIGLSTALLSGLVPGLVVARRLDLDRALRADARGSTGTASAHRAHGLLLAGQVALAFAVLAAAGLLGRSFLNLRALDLGYRPEGVLTAALELPDWKYPGLPEQRAFFRTLLARLRDVPGVEAAGAAWLRPFEFGSVGVDAWHLLPGQPPERLRQNLALNYNVVTPGYFAALGTPVLRGRSFEERDATGAAGAVVVGAATAAKLWPGREAVGQPIAVPGAARDAAGKFVWQTVVGVVADTRVRGFEPPRLDVYVPAEQAPFPVTNVAVRSELAPAALLAALRRELGALDPDQPLARVYLLEELVGRARQRARLTAALLLAFALLALLLALVGLYALVAQALARRTREVGVRLALGASRRQVAALLLGEGLRPVAGGLLLGLLAALSLGGLLRGLLHGLGAHDAPTLAAVALVLLLGACAAALVPARRAGRVDPVAALRSE